MFNCHQFYINGEWVDPIKPSAMDIINPATEGVIGSVSLGSSADVDAAVAAAGQAFSDFSLTSREFRLELLEKILAVYEEYYDEIAQAISLEMGAPLAFAQKAQAATGKGHLIRSIKVLKNYEFETAMGSSRVFKEPIGVCGFICPWNWPINQIVCKVAPALAAGCTMVLKPSEIAPVSAYLFAKVLAQAGVPKGVFNLVNGDGPGVGAAIASHPDIAMVSFTGSNKAGILVAKAAADTVKRVGQELGGKSANIILDDVNFEKVIPRAVFNCMGNTGQSCNAPTRLLIPQSSYDAALALAKTAAEKIVLGDPEAESTTMGPVVSEAQFNKIQALIQTGLDEGATLITGGLGRPEGMDKGYYIKPTIFANVDNNMTIAREEIFGPVLCILPYEDEQEAITIANDSLYGLSAYVSSNDLNRARRVASKLRAGMVHINGAGNDTASPFGGYKQSGNGREWGEYGLEEFLEVKSVLGFSPA